MPEGWGLQQTHPKLGQTPVQNNNFDNFGSTWMSFDIGNKRYRRLLVATQPTTRKNFDIPKSDQMYTYILVLTPQDYPTNNVK